MGFTEREVVWWYFDHDYGETIIMEVGENRETEREARGGPGRD